MIVGELKRSADEIASTDLNLQISYDMIEEIDKIDKIEERNEKDEIEKIVNIDEKYEKGGNTDENFTGGR